MINILLSSLILCSFPLLADSIEQYPEAREYTSADRGYAKYSAPSLHYSGKYALTFDDGPHPIRTPLILDALKAYNVKVTFFTITSNIKESSFPLMKRILDEGHILASHGRFHDNSNEISKELWKARVKQSFVDLNTIYKKAGHVFNKFYYRFPYAAYGLRKDHHQFNSLKEISRELMGENCIQFAFWDIDSGDWIPKMTAQNVLNNFKATNEGGTFITYKTIHPAGRPAYQIQSPMTLSNPISGGVVLQHDIQLSSVEGTKLFLQYAQEKNLEIVRLDEVEEFKVLKDCRMK